MEPAWLPGLLLGMTRQRHKEAELQCRGRGGERAWAWAEGEGQNGRLQRDAGGCGREGHVTEKENRKKVGMGREGNGESFQQTL